MRTDRFLHVRIIGFLPGFLNQTLDFYQAGLTAFDRFEQLSEPVWVPAGGAGILRAMSYEPARAAGVETAVPESGPDAPALVGLPGAGRLAGARRFPSDGRLLERDLPGLIRVWIVPGYAPPALLLGADVCIVTAGS